MSTNKRAFSLLAATLVIILSFGTLFIYGGNSANTIGPNSAAPQITNSTYATTVDWQNFTLPEFPNFLYASNGEDMQNDAIISAYNSPLDQFGAFYINASWDLVFYNLQTNVTTLLHHFDNNIVSSWVNGRYNDAGLQMYQNNNGSIEYLYLAGENILNSTFYYESYNLYNSTFETYIAGSPFVTYSSFEIFNSAGWFLYNSNSASQNYIGNIYQHTANGLITTDPFTNQINGNTVTYINGNIHLSWGLDTGNNSLEVSLNYFNTSTLGHYNRIYYYPLASQSSTNDGNLPVSMQVLSNETMNILGYMQWNNTQVVAFKLNVNGNISNTYMAPLQYTSVRAVESTNQPVIINSGIMESWTESTPINTQFYNYTQNNIIEPNSNSWLYSHLQNLRLGYSISTTTVTSVFYVANFNGYRFASGNHNASYYESEAPNNNTQFMLMWFPEYTSEFSNSPTVKPQFYNVTIQETGLPSGTYWTFVFNGTQYTQTNTTYTLQEPNGTYSFSVDSISGYLVSAPSSVTVSGKSQTVTAAFTAQSGGGTSGPSTYGVTVSETGLPAGTTWYIYINGTTYSTDTSTMPAIYLPNGTYNYTISSSNSNYKPSPASGTVTIQGQPFQIGTVSFTDSVSGSGGGSGGSGGGGSGSGGGSSGSAPGYFSYLYVGGIAGTVVIVAIVLFLRKKGGPPIESGKEL